MVKYESTLVRGTQVLYDSVFANQNVWNLKETVLNGDVQIFTHKETPKNSSSFMSKSVVKLKEDSNIALATVFDKPRFTEYDEYLNTMNLLEDLGTITIQLSDGTEVKYIYNMLMHTTFKGWWPLFNPRDAVHLFSLGVFEKNGQTVYINITNSIPANEAKHVPVPSNHIRAFAVAGGAVIAPAENNTSVVQQLVHNELGGGLPKKILKMISSVDTSNNIRFKKCAEQRTKDYSNDVIASGELIKSYF